MTTLLVDIGNTRAKWAVLNGTTLGRMHTEVHEKRGAAVQAVVRNAPKSVDRIVAVSVAGVALERAFASAARKRFGVAPQLVRSELKGFGVVNGYREPWRLGADRWVSVIAAHELFPKRPVLVANVGTALTVDLIAADGRHLGGAIVPGPMLMIDSLLGETHGIRRRAEGGEISDESLFASNTASGLAAGAFFAAAAFIDRSLREARSQYRVRPELLLSGGAAAIVLPHLESKAKYSRDLVLRGLAVIARG
jgi:type III pantothenate kinase